MRVFKPKYRDKNGKIREVRKWWVETRDHLGIVRRFAGYPGEETARKQTESMGTQIERLVNFKRAGDPIDEKTKLWIDGIGRKLTNRLVEVGLLDDRKAKEARPLIEYVPEFQGSIKSRKVQVSSKQAQLVGVRTQRIIEDCGFKTWRDVSGDKINKYIESRRKDGMSQQTAHFYVQTFKRFGKWMTKQGYAQEQPEIDTIGASRNYGRAFELDEFERLLQAAKAGPVLFGLTGYERFLVYLLAVETGLRRGELQSLTPVSFDFKENAVFVKAEDTKNGDEALQLFTAETGRLLQEYVRGKMPNVRLFDLPDKTAKMIQADCRAAGIETANHKGKLTFHSLRHTCGSYLAAKGVHPKAIQEVMRHKDINLTMSRYTHLLSGQKRAAVNCMPRFATEKTRQEKSA